MYAAVRARHKGLLISNDELRDHIWGMLRPKHFLKWKARHIAQYRCVCVRVCACVCVCSCVQVHTHVVPRCQVLNQPSFSDAVPRAGKV